MIQNSSATGWAENKSQDDYLPARMVNEFVYCPRLFFLEHVEGQFAHNSDTVDGAIKHRRVDATVKGLPRVSTAGSKESETDSEAAPAGEATEQPRLHARSVTLASDRHQVLAKLDLVEASGTVATPIDYKRGRPKIGDDGSPTAWEPEQVQLCVQAFVLRENGYQCNEGILYFAESKQRVRIPITAELEQLTESALAGARALLRDGQLPPPLVDSPKCPRCSLVGICLPDESRACVSAEPVLEQGTLFDLGPRLYQISMPEREERPIRRLLSARDERRPLYVNTPGLVVGKSGDMLQIKEKGKTIREVRLLDTNQVNLMGPIQISTQALQGLMQAEIPVGFFSLGHWFYGITHGIGLKNIFTRREQFRRADDPRFCQRLANALVVGKIRNSRVMLMRNHTAVPAGTVRLLKRMEQLASQCTELPELLGIEGTAAAAYFSQFGGMLKVGTNADPFEPELNSAEDGGHPLASEAGSGDGSSKMLSPVSDSPWLTFDFSRRNRRPPRDPVNALLSLAYSVLAKELMITCALVGLDPYLGFYHQPRYGRPALALDLMEPFRPLIADSAVLSAINSRMVTPEDFVQAGDAVSLTPRGRKQFFLAFESRMDALVTHPLFGYRVSYRRMLEIQTRLLARMLCGEIANYPVFVTR